MMKPVFIALGAALALSACADYYGGRAPPGYYDAGGYNAYYDDAYGPFYDGYWDGDVFLFSRGRGRPFERDEAHHFHRAGGAGFHGVHGNFHRPSGPMAGRPRG
jgi:hypothetical protein